MPGLDSGNRVKNKERTHPKTPTQEFPQVRAAPSHIEVLRVHLRQIEDRSRRVATALPSLKPTRGFLLAVLRLAALHEVASGGNGAIDGAAAGVPHLFRPFSPDVQPLQLDQRPIGHS